MIHLNNKTKVKDSELTDILIDCLQREEYVELYDENGNQLKITDFWEDGGTINFEFSPRK